MTALHLGDGAYATITAYGAVIITANHHDPQQATDVVEIEPGGIATLVDELRRQGATFGNDPEPTT